MYLINSTFYKTPQELHPGETDREELNYSYDGTVRKMRKLRKLRYTDKININSYQLNLILKNISFPN